MLIFSNQNSFTIFGYVIMHSKLLQNPSLYFFYPITSSPFSWPTFLCIFPIHKTILYTGSHSSLGCDSGRLPMSTISSSIMAFQKQFQKKSILLPTWDVNNSTFLSPLGSNISNLVQIQGLPSFSLLPSSAIVLWLPANPQTTL